MNKDFLRSVINESMTINADDVVINSDDVEVNIEDEDEVEVEDEPVLDEPIVDEEVVDEDEELDDEDEVIVESLKSKLESIRAKKSRNKVKKAKLEALRKHRKMVKLSAKKEAAELPEDEEEDPTLSVCPVCGSSEYDADSDTCPICGEDVHKYLLADEVPEGEDEYSTIEVDGDTKILVGEDGETKLAEPDELLSVLAQDTHEVVVPSLDEEGELDTSEDAESEVVKIDSGVATYVDDEVVNESADIPEDADTKQVAFLRIDQPLSIVEDMLTLEQDETDITVDTTDEGKSITFTPEVNTDEPVETLESEDADAEVTDEEPAEDHAEPVDDPEPVTVDLDEVEGTTLVHVDDIDSVPELVEVVNQLLPDDMQITESSDEDHVVTETGRSVIKRNGKMESVKVVTVRRTTEAVAIKKPAKKVASKKATPKKETKVATKAKATKKPVAKKKTTKEASLPSINKSGSKKFDKVTSTKVSDTKSETDIKLMSVLENRASAKIRKILCSLGVTKEVLESETGIKSINALVHIAGNIKEYRSGLKPNANGELDTLE